MASEPERMAYLGRAACGCIRMVVVDDPGSEVSTAQCVADAIKGGLTIERQPASAVGALPWRCPHHPKAEQAERLMQEGLGV